MRRNSKDFALYGAKYGSRTNEVVRDARGGNCGCSGAKPVSTRPTGGSTLYPNEGVGYTLGPIFIMPQFGQGYLVLNRTINPSIAKWQITMTRRTMENGVPKDTMAGQFTVSENYWKVPIRYMTDPAYLVTVNGLSSANKSLVQEGPVPVTNNFHGAMAAPGLNSWTLGCKWVCNGIGYAWQIQQYLDPNGYAQYYYALEETFDYIDPQTNAGVPFYSYMSDDAFHAYYYTGPGTGTHPVNWANVVTQPNPIMVNNHPMYWQDDEGNLIDSNVVYGVAKGLRQWDGQDGVRTSNQPGEPPDCSLATLGGAIATMNNESPIAPELECSPFYGSEPWDGGPEPGDGVPTEVEWRLVLEFWMKELEGNGGDSGGGRIDPVKGLQAIYKGLLFSGLLGSRGMIRDYSGVDMLQISKSIAQVRIIDLGNSGQVIETIDTNRLADSSKSDSSFYLSPGYYCLGITLIGPAYLPLMFEVKR